MIPPRRVVWIVEGPAMSEKEILETQFYAQITDVIKKARNKAYRSINSVMVRAYWNIGRLIIQEEQKGKSRADYGHNIVASLAKRLTTEYGKGFDKRNLWYMRLFYITFQLCTHCVHN